MIYLATRLCSPDSALNPASTCRGDVEVRPASADSAKELAALERSKAAHGYAKDLELCPRLSAIVRGESLADCDREAERLLGEAVDVLALDWNGLGKYALLELGYFRSLEGGSIVERTPDKFGERRSQPSTVFHIQRERFPLPSSGEILASRFFSRDHDLGLRIHRAAHWARRAQWEADAQLRILFRWFAVEAMWKIDEDTDIPSIMATCLGFPGKAVLALMSPRVLAELNRHPRYKSWRRQVQAALGRNRTWRNDSVHSGFRRWEIAPKELAQFDNLTELALPRALRVLEAGLLAGLTTAAEVKEYLGILLSGSPNLVQDVHGNVIYTLEHPFP